MSGVEMVLVVLTTLLVLNAIGHQMDTTKLTKRVELLEDDYATSFVRFEALISLLHGKCVMLTPQEDGKLAFLRLNLMDEPSSGTSSGNAEIGRFSAN